VKTVLILISLIGQLANASPVTNTPFSGRGYYYRNGNPDYVCDSGGLQIAANGALNYALAQCHQHFTDCQQVGPSELIANGVYLCPYNNQLDGCLPSQAEEIPYGCVVAVYVQGS
jgi:hypothetical protein